MKPRIATHRICQHCGHRVPWHHVGWTRNRGWHCLLCTGTTTSPTTEGTDPT